MIGADIYWFVMGQCQNIYDSNCNLTLSNVYDINATSPAMTLAQGPSVRRDRTYRLYRVLPGPAPAPVATRAGDASRR